MKMMNSPSLSKVRLLAAAASIVGLSACSTVGYRCPLDPDQKPESPTACAGMFDALAGAKANTGGKTSVLMDDKGRLVPIELIEQRPAVPLGVQPAEVAAYRAASPAPGFVPSKVFQAWTPGGVDAQGVMHEGHHSWFATPSRFAAKPIGQADSNMANALLQPVRPGELPEGRIVPPTLNQGARVLQQPAGQARPGQPVSNKEALTNLSRAADSAAGKAQPAAPAVTAPAVRLAD